MWSASSDRVGAVCCGHSRGGCADPGRAVLGGSRRAGRWGGLIEGDQLRILEPVGIARGAITEDGVVPLTSQMVLAAAAREWQAALGERPRRACAGYPDSARRLPGPRTFLAVPLVVRGRPSAPSASSSQSPGCATDEIRSLALLVAQLGSQALERAMLFDEERELRAGSSRSSRSRLACRRATPEEAVVDVCRSAREAFGADAPPLDRAARRLRGRPSRAGARRLPRAPFSRRRVPPAAACGRRASARLRPRRAFDPQRRRLRGGDRGGHADSAPDSHRRGGRPTACSSSNRSATCPSLAPDSSRCAELRRPGGARARSAERRGCRRWPSGGRRTRAAARLGGARGGDDAGRGLDGHSRALQAGLRSCGGRGRQGDRAGRQVRGHRAVRLRGTICSSGGAAFRSRGGSVGGCDTAQRGRGAQLREERDRRYPGLARAPIAGRGSSSPFPCASQGGPSAVWRCRSPGRARFTARRARPRRRARRQAGQAFERARLLESEQQARARAERLPRG